MGVPTSPSRARRALQIAAGLLLAGLALAVRLTTRSEALRDTIEAQPLLGWLSIGLSWACLLGAVALLAAGVFARPKAGARAAPTD